MLSDQPSRTLLRPAVMRAAHQLFDRPLIFDDPMALRLIPEATEGAIAGAATYHTTAEALLLRSMFALRSRFAEDRLEGAVNRGVRQYLVLGAGLDTFPWRQPDFAQGIQIFFCDHPASLSWSKRCFEARELSVPANLRFVPIDLEQRDLARWLAAAGFSHRLPTFVSMLGLLQYLTSDTINELLAWGGSLPPRSEIVLSFVLPDAALDSTDRGSAEAAAVRATKMGEPWLTRLTSSHLIDQISRFGFADAFHLSPELAQQRYFAGRQDGLQPPRREQLISAIT